MPGNEASCFKASKALALEAATPGETSFLRRTIYSFNFLGRSAVEEFSAESDRDVEEKLARLARKQVRLKTFGFTGR